MRLLRVIRVHARSAIQWLSYDPPRTKRPAPASVRREVAIRLERQRAAQARVRFR